MTYGSVEIEVVIAETFRITGRGTAAMLVDDPKPWWPISAHRVRVVRPDGIEFETDASVELALVKDFKEMMVLVFPFTEDAELPPGSRVTSLAVIPHTKRGGTPARKWWQFWGK